MSFYVFVLVNKPLRTSFLYLCLPIVFWQNVSWGRHSILFGSSVNLFDQSIAVFIFIDNCLLLKFLVMIFTVRRAHNELMKGEIVW